MERKGNADLSAGSARWRREVHYPSVRPRRAELHSDSEHSGRVLGAAFTDSVHSSADRSSSTAQHNTAQPQHSQPPQRRSPARCCVKLPLAQSEPAPSYTRSAATGSGPSRAQYRAWAGAASPERVRRSREAAIRRPATMSRRLAAASEPEGRVFGSAFSGRHKQKGASE